MAGLVTSFFLVFVLDVTSLRYFRGEVRQAQGVITKVDATVFSTATFTPGTGMLHDRGREICQYRYHYEAGGAPHPGESYGLEGEAKAGDSVVVEYSPNQPSVSRIQGMSPEIHLRGGFVPVLVVAVVLLIAWVALFGRLREAWSMLRLLRTGHVTEATVVSKTLLARNSGREWCEYLLAFSIDGRDQASKIRPHYACRLREGESRSVLFDPTEPGEVRLLDTFPHSIRWTATGLARSNRGLGVLAPLIIPTAATASVLASLYLEFIG